MHNQSAEFAGLKIDQLPELDKGNEGYAYYCKLCGEVLVVSRRIINPRKVGLIFNETCPGCGFRLESVLEGQTSAIPEGRTILTNPRCADAKYLADQQAKVEFNLSKATILLSDQAPTLTTGIAALDQTLVLGLGHLAVLHGKASHSLSALLCVRAVLERPLGLDSDVVFIDGGNSFDAYLISEHSIKHELDSEKVLARIHLSRAFTYHQLSRLITEKLPHALDNFKAELAVVSDITQLYCDPDIKTKQEALDVFRKNIRSLATIAEQKSVLIIVTNPQTKNRRMENVLLHTAHVTAKLDDNNAFTKLTLARHPFTPQLKATLSVDKQTLESYM
jgi:predicted RNA-binding Zn-ribbon protein involved in translation (DUF1610 family)